MNSKFELCDKPYKWQLWQDSSSLRLTPWPLVTHGPARLPADQTQWPQLGPFCPWSPPDVDNWPECPDQASLVAQRLKHLPAMWETWVRSLGWEDPLEKETKTPSNILAWRIPWMEELGGLQSTGRKELDTTEQLHFFLCYLLMIESSFLGSLIDILLLKKIYLV